MCSWGSIYDLSRFPCFSLRRWWYYSIELKRFMFHFAWKGYNENGSSDPCSKNSCTMLQTLCRWIKVAAGLQFDIFHYLKAEWPGTQMRFIKTQRCAFSTFTWKPDAGPLNACTCLSSSSQAHQDLKSASSCEVVNHFFAIYATSDVMAETYLHTTSSSSPPFKVRSNMPKHSGQRPYAAGWFTTNTISR